MIDVNLFYVAFICYALAMVLYFFAFGRRPGGLVRIGRAILAVGFVLQAVGLVIRSIHARFMPVTNMYEAVNVFSWIIVAAYLVTERRWRYPVLGAFVLPVVFLLMAFSSLPSTSKEIVPLIPALQSQWLVWHVLLAFIGEAGFAVAFGASIMFLIRARAGEDSRIAQSFPSLDTLDTISYRAISIGFPLFTLGALIFGAIWANYAWGRYWSWDPKETWALITWFVYAIYLHVRIVHGWKGRLAAWVSIGGFLATMITLFGVNYFLSGLHSYS